MPPCVPNGMERLRVISPPMPRDPKNLDAHASRDLSLSRGLCSPTTRRDHESQETNGFETAHPCLLEPNDEILASGLHDFFGHDCQSIGS